MEMTTRGGSGLGFPYQEMQKIEAITVAKQAISRCSGCLMIARRSLGHGQQDLGEDGLIALERKQEGYQVWEVLRDLCR
jgi:hypothetical protein